MAANDTETPDMEECDCTVAFLSTEERPSAVGFSANGFRLVLLPSVMVAGALATALTMVFAVLALSFGRSHLAPPHGEGADVSAILQADANPQCGVAYRACGGNADAPCCDGCKCEYQNPWFSMCGPIAGLDKCDHVAAQKDLDHVMAEQGSKDKEDAKVEKTKEATVEKTKKALIEARADDAKAREAEAKQDAKEKMDEAVNMTTKALSTTTIAQPTTLTSTTELSTTSVLSTSASSTIALSTTSLPSTTTNETAIRDESAARNDPAAKNESNARSDSSAINESETKNVSAAPIRSVTFVTEETRGDPLLKNVGNVSAGPANKIINLGPGHKWRGYKTKVELFDTFLRSWNAEGLGKEIVAFVDGSDVFWAGCETDDFMHAYDSIVAASGAPVVFSAEIVCGEQDCNKVPDVPQWAEKLAGNRNLNGGFWDKYQEGCKGTWNDECSAKRDCGFWAPCAVPPAVKFLNSGFFMGPVDELAPMMEWTLRNYDNVSVFGDQSAFSMYWLEHPDKVTLDYQGELALSLSDLGYNLLWVDHDRHVIQNKPFDRTQCLIHGNGRGIWHMKSLLKKLTGKSFAELRGY